MKAMVLAAGLGSRLGEMGRRTPKCLMQAGGRTLLEHVMERLKGAGVASVVINLFHLADQVADFIHAHDDFGLEVELSRETALLGTGGGLLRVASSFKAERAFLMHNADIYTDLDLRSLIDWHEAHQALGTLAVQHRVSQRYLLFDRDSRLMGWRHMKDGEEVLVRPGEPEALAFSGIQVLSPGLLPYLEGHGTEFSITTAYLAAAAAGEAMMSYCMDGVYWMDVGTPERLAQLSARLEAGASMGLAPGMSHEADSLESQVDRLQQLVAQQEAQLAEQTVRLRLLTDELSRSNHELEQFAYVASHDLQVPLRTLTSYVQLLEKKLQSQPDERTQKYIRHALDAGARMQSLISDLLTYSRAHSTPLSMGPVDLADVFHQIQEALKGQLAESGGSLTAQGLPVVRGDVGQLTTLFQCLIENAVKFRSGRPLSIVVAAAVADGMAIISVRDNGIGFDSHYAARIFNMFQRLHEPGKDVGNGIGLSIAKKIVDRHGGSISAESSPGLGAAFIVRLPAPDATV